ncbi:MAG: hypothetical protein LBC96_10280 [Lachnospiraceae bacterium]|jgi:hypothetical protein|nr:hypothetical protein [Lachnospiraceae bacterium]
MAKQIIIPMIILAHRLKTALQVPSISPNYKTALQSYLGKDSTPAAFNKNSLLKKGVHLHFILPSAMKRGTETLDEHGELVFDYPCVPDRFTITRMYEANGKILTDCHVVESNFYSLDSSYQDSITIPKFDDLRTRHRFRYLGRTYRTSFTAIAPPPPPLGEYGYFDRITAVGAGDPLFSAYYPSCMSVFGFHDDLAGVPANAVLTYCVTGHYSNPVNDIFAKVQNISDMQQTLAEYSLSIENQTDIANSSILFGIVGGLDLKENYPPPLGEINIGIGKSSAEALSAIIKGIYYQDKPDIERFLSSIQYDTAAEASQPDGNFRIDDDIHNRGFTLIDAIEKAYTPKLPKSVAFDGFGERYDTLCCHERELGQMRRLLEYKKNSLYYLWEIHEDAASTKKKVIKPFLERLMTEIEDLRKDIFEKIKAAERERASLQTALQEKGACLEETASEAFFLAKDPVAVLFGSGMNRTYAFGEEGRFETDETLFCLTAPLTSDITTAELLSYFHDLDLLSDKIEDIRVYAEADKVANTIAFSAMFAVSALLLDSQNLLPALNLKPTIKEKHSPILYNGNPVEQVTLLLQWETDFYPDYDDSHPAQSHFLHGNTDYIYYGERKDTKVACEGFAVLTPHGIYNLEEKLRKYLELYTDTPDIAALVGQIKNLAAISQNLGGFGASLVALRHAFQFPIDIAPNDRFSESVALCLRPASPQFAEAEIERLAVRGNTAIHPLREGFFSLSKLALLTSFGIQRRLLDDELSFKGKRYFSENLEPIKDELCFFPLALTSPARLSASFVAADNHLLPSSPFLDSTPVIAILMPDMLNRNLNLFTRQGESIGVLKTAYRKISGKKTAVGRFLRSPLTPPVIDDRITNFISALTKDNTNFAELMAVIDTKIEATLPLSANDFIFGRVLVLAEIAVELEYFGLPEWSKRDLDIGKEDDLGLSNQSFPVMFGDKDRVMDGVCCGFSDGFERGFAAFGISDAHARYLSANPLMISSQDSIRNVTLLFDPMLKVTINTALLPVKQLELDTAHLDFSGFSLMSAQLDNVIHGEKEAELPDFTHGAQFDRFYPRINDGVTVYEEVSIVTPTTLIETIGNTIISDGLIVKRNPEQ